MFKNTCLLGKCPSISSTIVMINRHFSQLTTYLKLIVTSALILKNLRTFVSPDTEKGGRIHCEKGLKKDVAITRLHRDKYFHYLKLTN